MLSGTEGGRVKHWEAEYNKLFKNIRQCEADGERVRQKEAKCHKVRKNETKLS
jgi:hypothetical protein